MSTPSQSSHESYRFAVHGHTLGVGDSQVIQVYEVKPVRGEYGFHLLATLSLGDSWTLGRFWVSGDRVYVVRTSGLFIVWDFVNSGIVSWFLPDLSGEVWIRRQKLVDIDDVVILLGTTDFYAWRVPGLRRMDPQSTWAANYLIVDPPFHRAAYKNDADLSASSDPDVILRSSNWINFSPCTTLTLDLVQTNSSQIKRLKLCLRTPEDERGVDATVQCAPRPSAWLESRGQPGIRYYSSDGENIYFIEPSWKGESPAIHSSASSVKGDALWRTVELCSIQHPLDATTLICPYSGRFAYACLTHHDDGLNRIHVVDLLDP